LPGSDRWQGVRVLGYHRIASTNGDTLAVSPEVFRRQMEQVLESGATPVRLAEVLDELEAPVEGRYVCVTFDDGYRDNVEHAEPVLRELGIPGTIFLPTAVPGGESSFFWYDDPPPSLSWDEVAEVAAREVIDVQSHTRTHAWLPRLGDAEARGEIFGSKAELEERLGRPVTMLAYPAGLHGEREAALVQEAGYRAAVTTDPGVNRGGEGSVGLRRTLIFGEDNDTAFLAKLRGTFDGSPMRAFLNRRRGATRDGNPYGRLHP
jgi:peptidoglycan/xylan/chitin deacetylase (PgdA/CDA1 family)